MGVLGLWEILESVGHPVKVEGLEGKVLAVDANIWLYKFIRGFREKDNATNIESHKLGLFNRIAKLLFYRIKPVFVFDGPAPVLKRRTLERRQNVRNKTLSKVQDAAMRALANQLKTQYPGADIDHLRITLPELRSNNLVAAEKLGDEDFNLFYLPPQEEEKGEQGVSENDDDSYSDDELRSAIQHSAKVNVDSKDFEQLPPEIRYEILQDIKAKRRRIRNVTLPEDAGSFSSLQLARLVARRGIQEKIEKCEKDICTNYTGELADGKTIQAFRVQSDARSTILYRNNSYDPNALAQPQDIKQEAEKPIESENKSEGLEEQKPSTIRRPKVQAGPSPIRLNLRFKKPALQDLDETIELSEEEEESEPDQALAQQPSHATNHREEQNCATVERTDESAPLQKSPLIESDRIESVSNPSTPRSSPPTPKRPNASIASNQRRNETIELSDDEDQSDDESDNNPPPQRTEQSQTKTPLLDKGAPDLTLKNHVELGIMSDSTSTTSSPEPQPTPENANDGRDLTADSPSKSSQRSATAAAHETIELTDDDDEDDHFQVKVTNSTCVQQTKEADVLRDIQAHAEPPLATGQETSPSQGLPSNSTKTAGSSQRVAGEDSMPARPLVLESSQMREQSEHLANAQRATNKVTSKIIEDAKELLRLFGIPYMDAAGEAEAQCAKLEELKLTMGTITDDSDIWLFGSQNVYRYFFSDDKYVMQYKMPDIEYHIRMTRENLVCFAMLVGGDYTDGIMNVGAVTALEILSEFPGQGLEPLAKFSDWHRAAPRDKKRVCEKQRKKLLKYNIPDEFPSRAVYEAYMQPAADLTDEEFTWGMPELDELREYARRNFGWDQKRADEKLLPVMKKLNEKIQKTIDTFFFKTQANRNPEMFRSKRVNQALNKIAKRAALDPEVVNLSEDEEDS